LAHSCHIKHICHFPPPGALLLPGPGADAEAGSRLALSDGLIAAKGHGFFGVSGLRGNAGFLVRCGRARGCRFADRFPAISLTD